jgi:hypothetical protein
MSLRFYWELRSYQQARTNSYAIVYPRHDPSLMLRSVLRSNAIMVAVLCYGQLRLPQVQEALSSSPSVPMTGLLLLTSKNAYITTSTELDILVIYMRGQRQSAIAEQIAAAYVTLHIKAYEPEDHHIKEHLL